MGPQQDFQSRETQAIIINILRPKWYIILGHSHAELIVDKDLFRTHMQGLICEYLYLHDSLSCIDLNQQLLRTEDLQINFK